MTADSRRQHATLAAKVRRDDDGTLLVLAPCVGRFREGPGVGSRVLVYDAVDGDLLHSLKGM